MTTSLAMSPPSEYVSTTPFEPTLARLTAAIEAAGMIVFARIDHTAGALAAGLVMPPTVVLLYGNPQGGTPIMLAAPLAALDLPLRVLVRERMPTASRGWPSILLCPCCGPSVCPRCSQRAWNPRSDCCWTPSRAERMDQRW